MNLIGYIINNYPTGIRMKKIVGSLILISFFLFSSCSKDTITSPPLNKTTGTVSLQFDKINAPQNVVNIIAYLSRAGYDTLKGNLNLLSDTSADILIQNIPAGQWHLTINALNDSNLIVYSGETDVTISDGITTQVNLALVPTGQGRGSIYIIVNWGNANPLVIDFINNPILTVAQNPSNPKQISEPKILYDNGIYKMWYLSGYSQKANVWYAESPDGINWVNKLNNPVLDVGTNGAWDNLIVGARAIIKDNNKYLMYYSGAQSPYGQSLIGLAISNDGINWQKYSNPAFMPDSVKEYYIGSQSVVKVNGIYYMFYDSSPQWNYNQFVINLATSTDGVTWSRNSTNPILTPSLSWEGIGITYPSVIYDGNQFKMIYESTDRNNFGYATSFDGIHWTKNSKPVFSNNVQNHRPTIDYPCFIKVGNEYRIYYAGSDLNGRLDICFARAFNM